MGKIKQMIDLEQERQMIWIEEILSEAESYNLRQEVFELANEFLHTDPELNIVDAHQKALELLAINDTQQ